MRFISKFRLPKNSIVNAKEMKICEELCCANIILTIRKRLFNLARRRCAKFISLLQTAPEGFQPIYDWRWLGEILSDIEKISEILKQKHSEEENVNISMTAQNEKATEKMPIKRSKSSDKTSIPEEEYLEEPVAKRRHFEKKPDPAQRIRLELSEKSQCEATESKRMAVQPRILLPNLTTAELPKKRRRVSSDSEKEFFPAQRIRLELSSDTQLGTMPVEAPIMELGESDGVAVPLRIQLTVPESSDTAEPVGKRPYNGSNISTGTDDEGYPCIPIPIPTNFQKPAIICKGNAEDPKL